MGAKEGGAGEKIEVDLLDRSLICRIHDIWVNLLANEELKNKEAYEIAN